MNHYRLYLDESGTDRNSEYLYVAGCFMTEKAWLQLESNWRTILEEFGVTRFRASDCEAAQGAFKNWERNKRNSIFLRLAEELNRHEFVICRISINKEVFNKVASLYSTIDVSPYEFSVVWYVLNMGLLLKILDKQGEFHIIFEKGQNVRFHVRQYIEKISKRKDYELSIVDFKAKGNSIPYQVADLIVWEYQKYTKNRLSDRNSPVRPSLKALIRNPERFISKDYDFVHERDLEAMFCLIENAHPDGFGLK